MSCQIQRDTKGNIAEVKAPNNKPSLLYKALFKENLDSFKQDPYIKQILNEGLIKSLEQDELALGVWSKTYSNEFKDSTKDVNGETVVSEVLSKSKPDKSALIQLVNKLGFNVEEFTNVDKEIFQRKGIDNVEAFIDLAKGIIKTKKGDAYSFSEEAAHLAIAAIDKGFNFEKVLELVINTTEYKDNYSEYQKAYKALNKEATKEEIERKIRIEVLGKLLAEHLNGKPVDTVTSLSQRIKRYLRRLWSKLMKHTNTDILQDFLNKVASDINTFNLESFKQENIIDTDTFFNLGVGDVDRIKSKLEGIIKTQQGRLNVMEKRDNSATEAAKKRIGDGLVALEDMLKKGNDSTDDNIALQYFKLGLTQFLRNARDDMRGTDKAIGILQFIQQVKDGKSVVTSSTLEKMRDFIAYYEQDLEEVKRMIRENNSGFLRQLKTVAGSIVDDLGDIKNFHEVESRKLAIEFAKENNLNPEYDIEKHIDETHQESSTWRYYIGALRNASDNLLRIVHAKIQSIYNQVDLETRDFAKEFEQKLEALGFLGKSVTFAMEKLDGKFTGRFLGEKNIEAFNRARKQFTEDLYKALDLPEDWKERSDIIEGWKTDYDEYSDAMWKWKLSNDPNDPTGILGSPKPKIEDYGNAESYKFYASELGTWFDTHSQTKREVTNYLYTTKKGEKKKGINAYIAMKKDKLNHNAYMQWRALNLGKKKNGKLFPKGELVEPTAIYNNPEYTKLTANQKAALEVMKEYKEKADDLLQQNGDSELLPQISASKADLFKSNRATAQHFKDNLKKGILSDADDSEYGNKYHDVRPDGTKKKFVPIYWNKMMPDPDNITSDLGSSIIMYFEMAKKFEQFSKEAPTLEVLVDRIRNRRYESKDGSKVKLGAETTTFKVLQEFIDTHVYGELKEEMQFSVLGRKINVTKVIDKINGYFRNVNLGLNLPSALAGYLSGSGFAKIEDLIGKHTTQESAHMANKEWWKEYPKMISEIGKINKTSKLGLILEELGVMDSNMSLWDNLDKSTVERLALDSPEYAFHKAFDLRMKGKITLSVLYNTRLINGEWLNKHQVEDNDVWQNAENLYDHLTVNNSRVKFPKELHNKLVNKVNYLAQKIDGVLSPTDRAAAHKTAVGQLIMTHRGFIPQGIGERFRKRGVNYMTEEFDEGYYRTTGRLIGDYTSGILRAKGGIFSPERVAQFKSLVLRYNELSDDEKLLVKRALYEMMFVFAMVVVATFINNAADEDDDNYMLQLFAYQANRVLIESATFTPFMVAPTVTEDGIGLAAGSPMIKEAFSVLNSPFASLRHVESMVDFIDFFSTEDVTKGKYEGMTRIQRNLIKMTPAIKGLYNLRDPKSTNEFLKNKTLAWVYVIGLLVVSWVNFI